MIPDWLKSGIELGTTLLDPVLNALGMKTQTSIAQDNLAMQKNQAEQNLALQQSQFDYQKQLNETQMEREDTAIQRQMADAKAAGLSPLSVVGSNGAAASPLTSSDAPQMDMTGISAAQSQYMDIAKTYTSLQLQANQSNLNRWQQREASKRGAEVALKQLDADMEMKRLQLAEKYDELKMQKALNDSQMGLNAKQMDNIQSEIDYRNAEREYNEEHGFRNQSIDQAIVSILTEFVDKKSRGSNDTFIDKTIGVTENAIKNTAEGLDKKVAEKIATLPPAKRDAVMVYLTAIKVGAYNRIRGSKIGVAYNLGKKAYNTLFGKNAEGDEE